jgi:Carboxypeptidase regulatory-like domain
MHRRTTDLVRPLHSFLLIVGFAFVLAAPTLAENVATPDARSGSIAGTVTDPNGDTVPGATVILQGPGSSDRYTTLANENGFFELGDVKSGVPYRVIIHANGFADWTSPSMVLEPGQYKILLACKMQLAGVRTTVNVGYSSVEVATEQVAVEEKQRVLGLIPNFYVTYDPNPAPLTAKLKFQLAVKVAADPVTVLGVGFVAGIRQAADSPNFQQGAKGYGQRYGVTAATGFTDIMIGGAILPSLLHQDPRYFYQGTGTTKSRIFHAISNPFVCRGDNGDMQPNYSSLGGDLISSAISNAYYPRSNRGAGLVFGNFAIGTAERVVSSLAQEFLLRRLTPKAPK